MHFQLANQKLKALFDFFDKLSQHKTKQVEINDLGKNQSLAKLLTQHKDDTEKRTALLFIGKESLKTIRLDKGQGLSHVYNYSKENETKILKLCKQITSILKQESHNNDSLFNKIQQQFSEFNFPTEKNGFITALRKSPLLKIDFKKHESKIDKQFIDTIKTELAQEKSIDPLIDLILRTFIKRFSSSITKLTHNQKFSHICYEENSLEQTVFKRAEYQKLLRKELKNNAEILSSSDLTAKCFGSKSSEAIRAQTPNKRINPLAAFELGKDFDIKLFESRGLKTVLIFDPQDPSREIKIYDEEGQKLSCKLKKNYNTTAIEDLLKHINFFTGRKPALCLQRNTDQPNKDQTKTLKNFFEYDTRCTGADELLALVQYKLGLQKDDKIILLNSRADIFSNKTQKNKEGILEQIASRQSKEGHPDNFIYRDLLQLIDDISGIETENKKQRSELSNQKILDYLRAEGFAVAEELQQKERIKWIDDLLESPFYQETDEMLNDNYICNIIDALENNDPLIEMFVHKHLKKVNQLILDKEQYPEENTQDIKYIVLDDNLFLDKLIKSPKYKKLWQKELQKSLISNRKILLTSLADIVGPHLAKMNSIESELFPASDNEHITKMID